MSPDSQAPPLDRELGVERRACLWGSTHARQPRRQSASRWRRVLPLVFIGVLCLSALLLPEPAEAGIPFVNEIKNIIITAFLSIIVTLINIVMWFLGILLSITGLFIDFVLSVQRLAGAPAVIEGWRFTRDTLNFVFILALLAIAFATIAGIESYGMRALLPRLLIAALLVNFSLAIAGAFIQVASVISTSLINTLNRSQAQAGNQAARNCRLIGGTAPPGGGTSLSCHIAHAAGIARVYKFGPTNLLKAFGLEQIATFTDEKAAGGGVFRLDISTEAKGAQLLFTTSLNALMAVFFLMIFLVAMIALVIMLSIRIAMLVLLLVLAPVPYAFSIIPRAAAYGEKWWESFLSYTFFLPVVVFFLVLSINMVGAAQNWAEVQFGMDSSVFTPGGREVLLALYSIFFTAAFIMVSLVVARTMGLIGAQAALGFAQRVTLGTARAGLYGPQLAGRAAARLGYEDVAKPLGATRPVAAALRPLRAVGRGAQRLFGAEAVTAQQQVEEQQKKVKGLSKDELSAAMLRGNAGAAAELSERDELDKKGFARARQVIPRGTIASEKLEKKYQQKFPVPATTGLTQEEIEAGVAGAPGSPASMKLERALTSNLDRLGKALRKVKPEDYAKMDEASLEALAVAVERGVVNIEHVMPNAGQLRRGAEEGSPQLQTALERLARVARQVVETAPPTAVPPRLRSVKSTIDRFFPT